ncbi:MAG: hypothetical protein IK121_09960, partial [Lachnospiraceae bacterium]|nr:hypothetical protein [Lachnospiraceae bacterium]
MESSGAIEEIKKDLNKEEQKKLENVNAQLDLEKSFEESDLNKKSSSKKSSLSLEESLKEKLSGESFAPEEGLILKKAGGENAPDREKEKALKDAFLKYGRLITENNIRGLLNVKKDNPEKGSVYYKQMREAAENVRSLTEMLEFDNGKISSSMLMNAMTRLSETAHIYYDTHRGMRVFKKGENRKEACNLIRDLTEHFFDDLGLKVLGEGMVEKSAPISLEGEDGVKAVSALSELAKYYKKWRKHFAFNEADERNNVKEKADLFSVYKHEMDVVRSLYRKDPGKMDPDIAFILKEARYYSVQNRVLESFERTEVIEGDPLMAMAKKHSDEMDYKKAEEKLEESEVDRHLSKAQLRAVEEADRWFIRNYNNGGLVGRPLNIKNHHGEIVSALMSRTKRERLFIYYLIETGARKDPKVFDAYASQTEYIPDLKKIKGQMIASKLKIMSRLVGGYVYMHKLSEALLINREYKELIRDSAKIISFEKEGVKDAKASDPEELRSIRLKKAFFSCMDYKNKAEACSLENGDKKEILIKETEAAEKKYNDDLNALIEADELLLNHQDSNMVDLKSNMDTYSAVLQNASAYAGMGANIALTGADVLSKKSGGVAWRLKGSTLAGLNKYAHGYSSSAISALGHSMAMLYGIYNLTENGAKMHAGDIGKEIASILKSGADTYISYRSGTELVAKYSALAKDFDASKTVKLSGKLQTAAFITSGVGLMINTYNIASGSLDCINSDNAAKYLEAKHRSENNIKNEPENDTEEEREKRFKKKREIRYE